LRGWRPPRQERQAPVAMPGLLPELVLPIQQKMIRSSGVGDP
jgi:hypothetical protein